MNKLIWHIFFVLFIGISPVVQAQNCRIGDVITNRNDNTRGVVFWISPDRTTGWMVAFHDLPESVWGKNGALTMKNRNVYDTAGYNNTKIIRTAFERESEYAAKNINFENGWYLPAIGQLACLATVRPVINQVFEAYGGELLKEEYYWSSTISDNMRAFKSSSMSGMEFPRVAYCKIRAVRTFSLSDFVFDTTLTYRWSTGSVASHIKVSPLLTTNYTVAVNNRSGCSVVESRRVFVSGNEIITIYDTIRQGEVYDKNGFYETNGGTYIHSIPSAIGCDVTIQLILKVLEPLPRTVFDESICEGTVYFGYGFTEWEAGTYIHKWMSKDGCDSVVVLNLSVLPSFHSMFEASICEGSIYSEHGFQTSEAGLHTLDLTSISGCDSIVTLDLVVLPCVVGITSLLEDCITHTYRFSITTGNVSSVVASSYRWSFGDGLTSSDVAPVHSYADSGRYDVTLSVKWERGDDKELNYSLFVPYYSEDFKIFSDRRTIDLHHSRLLLWTRYVPGLDYSWDFGDGITGTDYQMEHTYTMSGRDSYDVRLIVSNADHCEVEKMLNISVDQVFVIPNTFSPNGDGINDVFMPGYWTKVINRNGVVVYEGKGGWDGTGKGGQFPEDTYFYTLHYTLDTREETAIGYITLMR